MDPRPLAVLDMNAIIALKENEREVGSLRDVIDAWRQDRIRLAVSAIVGGERSRQEIGDEGGLIAMRPRLVAIGIGDIEVLGAPFILGYAFLGHAVLMGGELDEVMDAIANVLFGSAFSEIEGLTARAMSWWRGAYGSPEAACSLRPTGTSCGSARS